MYSIKGIKRILHKLPSFYIFVKINPKSIFSSQQQQQQRPPLLEDSRTPKQKKQDKDNNLSETNLAIALIAICVLHLLCQILRVFLAGLAVYIVFDTVWCMEVHKTFVPPLWTMCAECISSILIMINASGKIFYISFG